MDSDLIPSGWSKNPSRWSRRAVLIALGLIGLGIATYLTLYQMGVLVEVWEPFFGRGSEQVLHSVISRILPMPDAALGALAYLVEVITGVMGGQARWRTLPWITILFGAAAAAFGLVSILLVIFQGVWVHAWCTLCLASAAISILIAGLAQDELLASLQFLKRVRNQGQSPWCAFWGVSA